MSNWTDMIDRMCDRMCGLAQGGNVYTPANYRRLLADLGVTEDEAKRINVTGLTLRVFEVFCTEPEAEDVEAEPECFCQYYD